ncbi:SIS domain-containing protein [Geovibrio thiophilus]|uniref:SIS domain-containing protein n=1 Tax=Geovibrio thiophilus TaxID=139438 RepID=A0A410JVN0_9BACT|nr:SIS domain-containing protein [Geovibrio thiophilus]QAR32099.1 SIS domain-containing protein [Geovibrio thiophilus]
MNRNYAESYIKKLTALLENTDTEAVNRIIELLEELDPFENTVYFMGNGGSAATASHFATDLGVGLKLRGIKNFSVICLSDNIPAVTAISNDVGYDNIFYAQLKNRLKKGDVLVAISASGNSPNIVKAAEYAKKTGTRIIGCTGFDGGKLRELSDINFHVQTEKGEYGLVEDMHMILDHIIYSYFVATKEGASTKYTLE